MSSIAFSPTQKNWLQSAQRTHNPTLPTDGNPVVKQNFVYRMVFKDILLIDFFTNVQCYFTKHFYSETFIVF